MTIFNKIKLAIKALKLIHEVKMGKGLFRSKTVWGIILMMIPNLAKNIFDYDMSNDQATQLVQSILHYGGMILAVYGRYKASGQLKGLFNEHPKPKVK